MPNTGKNQKLKSGNKDGVIGYLPEVYTEFTEKYPKISQAYTDLADSCQNAGPLDAKTSRLIKLGVAIGTNSEGDVRSHTRRAVEEGISPAEIRHTVLLAFTTAGFHSMIAAYKWVEEVLGKAQ